MLEHNSAQKGELFLQGDIWSEQNQVKRIKDLIRPSLEWLSQHHWTDLAAHPRLFPAQALHLPAKYRTTDERDVNETSVEKKSKWIIHKPQNGSQVLNYVDQYEVKSIRQTSPDLRVHVANKGWSTIIFISHKCAKTVPLGLQLTTCASSTTERYILVP